MTVYQTDDEACSLNRMAKFKTGCKCFNVASLGSDGQRHKGFIAFNQAAQRRKKYIYYTKNRKKNKKQKKGKMWGKKSLKNKKK